MTRQEHNLKEEFPEARAIIHDLKMTDAHFARLFEEYDRVNHAVYRAAERIDSVTEEHEKALRRESLRLKDELYGMIRAAMGGHEGETS